VAGPAGLAVIANTGDDCEMYGAHVSPDPDLVTYWLADAIDARGYGIEGDSFDEMAALQRAGVDTWFRLGDRDLAMCVIRTEAMRAGRRLTEAHAEVVRAMGVGVRVLPMSDEPVRTHVTARGRRLPFQEFMIVERAEGPVEAVELEGAAEARPTPEVVGALARADAIVIGPSNPVISIGPILAVPGIREALAASPAPVVAVSPFVGGRALKGPTETFCEWAGLGLGSDALLTAYGDVVDGIVADEPPTAETSCPVLVTATLMSTGDGRRRLAEDILHFADSVRR
jgi:LPPG:FO 2-phospho-L-lactate transferase